MVEILLENQEELDALVQGLKLLRDKGDEIGEGFLSGLYNRLKGQQKR